MLAAGTLGVVLTGLWVWWGLEYGAFFESVAYPGAILLLLTLAVLLLSAPLMLARKGPHVVALGALFGLFGWTLLSLLWTPARDVAVYDGGKLLIYAASFLAGLMLANLLGRRLILAVIPYCLAGAIIAAVTTIALLGVDASQDLLDESGTLDYPFGYRNANAAFFIVIALGSLGVAAARSIKAPVGAGAAALAALCVQLAILSQSRGSAPALAVGALVLLAFSRDRLRLLALVLSVAGPVALATPTLLEPFSVAEDGIGAGAELRAAAEASLFAAAGSAVAALALLALIDRLSRHVQVGRRLRLSLATGTAALTLAAAIGFVLAVGNPVTWVSDQVSSRLSERSANSNTRFLYTGGRNRTDFWRVTLDTAKQRPVIGDGSGSFRQRYALERDSAELPLDAHSLPLETLAELGGVGLALLLIGPGAALVAIRRSARLGTETAALGAAALAAGAYYATHASIDWMWSFPGLTAPVIALLGMASAPAARSSSPVPPVISRFAAGVLAFFSLALVPLFISARYAVAGEANAAGDPVRARDQLEVAARLNPFADHPYLVAADIARREGNTKLALATLAKARERQPTEWVNYALAAQTLLVENPQRAEAEIRKARLLNPREADLDELERRLRRPSP